MGCGCFGPSMSLVQLGVHSVGDSKVIRLDVRRLFVTCVSFDFILFECEIAQMLIFVSVYLQVLDMKQCSFIIFAFSRRDHLA